MTKIAEAFQNKKAFIGFLTAGDPSLECTEEFIIKMEEAGAALIEIGIPFSDPIAEGPVIQSANVRALSNPNGCTTDQVFEMVERVSKKVSATSPFSSSGISGTIIPEIPADAQRAKKRSQPYLNTGFKYVRKTSGTDTFLLTRSTISNT